MTFGNLPAHLPDDRLLDLACEVGNVNQQRLEKSASLIKFSARDRRNNAHLVAGFDRRIQILQEANVFVVHIHIDEAIELVGALNSRVSMPAALVLRPLRTSPTLAPVGFDGVGAVGVTPQRRGDSDFDGVHLLILKGRPV